MGGLTKTERRLCGDGGGGGGGGGGSDGGGGGSGDGGGGGGGGVGGDADDDDTVFLVAHSPLSDAGLDRSTAASLPPLEKR